METGADFVLCLIGVDGIFFPLGIFPLATRIWSFSIEATFRFASRAFKFASRAAFAHFAFSFFSRSLSRASILFNSVCRFSFTRCNARPLSVFFFVGVDLRTTKAMEFLVFLLLVLVFLVFSKLFSLFGAFDKTFLPFPLRYNPQSKSCPHFTMDSFQILCDPPLYSYNFSLVPRTRAIHFTPIGSKSSSSSSFDFLTTVFFLE